MDSRAAQALRKKLTEVTQLELSKQTGISQSQLSRLAHGQRVLSSRQDGLALKREAGIELEWWDEPADPALGAAAVDDEEPKPTEAA